MSYGSSPLWVLLLGRLVCYKNAGTILVPNLKWQKVRLVMRCVSEATTEAYGTERAVAYAKAYKGWFALQGFWGNGARRMRVL
jgi:hypothetical protein